MEEEAIRRLVARLARPHRSGGHVVEGTAIRAEGPDFDAVEAWILARGGKPEEAPKRPERRGLYATRFVDTDAEQNLATARYVLPAGALEEPDPPAGSPEEDEPASDPRDG